MVSMTIDRRDGFNSSAAIKGPCRVATTAKVEHLRSEGRVSSDDETAMKLAEGEEEKALAYEAVLQVFAEYLGE